MITLTVEITMMRTLKIQNSREKAQKAQKTGDFGGRQPVSLHIMERCLASSVAKAMEDKCEADAVGDR